MTTQQYRKLQKHEAGIVGGWIYENSKMLADDNTLRIQWLVGHYLLKTSTEDGGWTNNYQDPEDGRYWQHSYPKSYMHGGGPPMLEHVTPVTIAYKQIKEALTVQLKTKLYDDVIEEQYHFGAFGSRYIVWSNNQRAIRLVWDGRDSRFVLEAANALPVTTYSQWNEIVECPFNPQLDEPLQWLPIAATQMNDSLREWKHN
jgi:hypothetical protein